MNVSVHFPVEVEDSLRRHAAAVGQDVETFVRTVVTESLERTGQLPERRRSPSEFAKRLDSWIALHPVLDHAIDDRRESIYSDCGR